METDYKKLIQKHPHLTHSESLKVTSHVQRNDGDWIINTLMLDGYDIPFKYRRKKPYKNLKGARVNLSYYPDTEHVAGIDFEIMKVVRIKIA